MQSSHLIGQLVAVHPAYDILFDAFASPKLRGHPHEQNEWARAQMIKAIKASHNLGLHVMPTFSGALLWPTVYPWPQRPAGLVELGFQELARRWQPLLNKADEYGIDLAYESVFSKLTQHGFTGWAVLEWEDPLKDSAQGAREGAALIRNMLIDTPTHAFDDFAGGQWDEATNRRILGLGT